MPDVAPSDSGSNNNDAALNTVYAQPDNNVHGEAPLLGVGSSGKWVKDLQRMLGFTGADVDGKFGPKTEHALVTYQKAHGLTPTGKTNHHTWRVLGSQGPTKAQTIDNTGSGDGGGATTGGHASRSSDRGPMQDGSPQWFAHQVLKGLGLPTSQANVDWLVAWESREGGHWENSAAYNPLNTTLSMNGDGGTMNGVGVRVYTSWQQGIDATVKTLAEGRYSDIRQALSTGHVSLDQHFQSLIAWSGGGYDNVSGGTVDYHPTGSGAGGGGTGAGASGGNQGPTDAASADGESGPSLDMKQLARQYGSIAAVLNDTQLTHLVKQAINKGWDDATFQAKLYETKFYQKHSDAQKNWLLLQNGPDKGEAQGEIHKKAGQIIQLAASMGVDLSHRDVLDLAQKALYNGFDDAQLQTAVGHHFEWAHGQHDAGQAGVFQDQYRQLAGAYGVPVSPKTLQGWVQRSLTGQMSPDSVKSYLEQQALSLYPGLAQQLRQGLTVADVAGPYRDSMANILELNPDAVKLTDPSVKKALQYMPDPAKPPTLMPMWQFEQQMRNDPRWLHTSNAKQSAMDVGVGILKDWGLTA